MIDADSRQVWLAGADGCRAGWVVAFVRVAGDEVQAALASEASGQRGNSIVRAPDTRPEPGSSAHVRVVPRFADVLTAPEAPVVVAVDIPIGLPERVGHGGRAAENAVRPLLGARQSSVFSVPSRAALAAEDYRDACAIALTTSEPPRKISKQLYMIAPKIREVDACLRAERAVGRVFEVHPEVAFWRLNGARALDEPKKIRGCCYEPGLALRRRLLIDAGITAAAVNVAAPKGTGADDVLDALACAAIARRIHAGAAQPFPDPPERDGYGLPMAIWA